MELLDGPLWDCVSAGDAWLSTFREEWWTALAHKLRNFKVLAEVAQGAIADDYVGLGSFYE